jgi:hypothetical protein
MAGVPTPLELAKKGQFKIGPKLGLMSRPAGLESAPGNHASPLVSGSVEVS